MKPLPIQTLAALRLLDPKKDWSRSTTCVTHICENPHHISLFDPQSFSSSQLLYMFQRGVDLEVFIPKITNADTLERLIFFNANWFNIADTSIFTGKNWANVLRHNPLFVVFCEWDKFSVADWYSLVRDRPEFMCHRSKIKNLR